MSWRSRTYDELPALAVRGPQLRQSLRVVTQAWMFGIVWMSCIGGSPLVTFQTMLGFNNFHFGLWAAIPFIATFAQLIAAILIERTGLKKYQFVQCGTAHRLLWMLMAGIPLFVALPSQSAVTIMLLLFVVSSVLGALGSTACMTWLGDLIPRRIRGRYFAHRFMVARPIQFAVVIVLGVAMDAVRDPLQPETAAAQPALMWTICGIFAVAAIFGAADILLFRKVPEVVRCYPDEPRKLIVFNVPRPASWMPAIEAAGLPRLLRGPARFLAQPARPVIAAGLAAAYAVRHLASAVDQLLIEPLKDGVFRNYVLYGATLTFATTVPGSFFWLNADRNLRFSKLAANFLFLVVSPVLGLIGASWWGRAIDRWGRKPVLIIASVGTWISVMPWFFATHDTPAPKFLSEAILWGSSLLDRLAGGHGAFAVGQSAPVGAFMLAMFAAVFGGIAWTGVQLAQNNIVLGFADGHGRSKYVAASAVLISVGGVLGGLCGGLVAQSLAGADVRQVHSIDVGPFQWNQWHATFAISFVVRLLAMFWLVSMPEPGAASTREIIRNVGVNVYNNIATMLFYPLRLFGWGRNWQDNSPKDSNR